MLVSNTPTQSICAVSVVIPLYNAEKYIGVCLESLLDQTLKDFEVLVVDDASTDNSPNIAESYLKKFGGRMKILTLPKNTGSAAIPRNVGLDFSCGKYIFFLDNDDLLIDTALETLYNFAEEYQTDVVSMMAGFAVNEDPACKNLMFKDYWLETDKRELILDVENFEERMYFFRHSQFEVVPWSRFLRREHLIKNKITFPTKFRDDFIWNLKLIFTVKRWLRIRIPLYVQRVLPDSLSRRSRSPEETISINVNPLINGVECLEEFMCDRDLFKQYPAARINVLGLLVNSTINHLNKSINELGNIKSYEILLREFSETSNPALISYLLLMINDYRNELSKCQKFP